MHHTASESSLARPFPTQGILRDGRAGLSGPLCNSAGPACTVDAPRLHINSANPANHAGASRASGPVPALSLFNPRTWGHEIDYAGSRPMLAGQMLVALVLARAVADVLAGGNVEHVRAHQETSITGKWDPGYAPGKTIDMTGFRASARALTPGGDDMYDAAARNEVIGRIDNGFYAASVKLDMLLDRAAPFKLYKLAGKPDHVATTAGAWVPMPPADPAAYAALVQARGFGTSITEVPQNEWDFFYQVAMAPAAGDVNSGGLVKRLESLLSSADALAQGQAAIAARQTEVVPVLSELTSEQLAVLAKYMAPEVARLVVDELGRRVAATAS